MTTRLMRTQHNRVLGGVCGGLGRYLNIDPVLVRLAFVLFTLAGGAGLLIYIILLIVMPLDTGDDVPVHYEGDADEQKRRTNMLIGGALIGIGIWYLLGQIPGLAWLSLSNLWPVALIIIGGLMIYKIVQNKEN